MCILHIYIHLSRVGWAPCSGRPTEISHIDPRPTELSHIDPRLDLLWRCSENISLSNIDTHYILAQIRSPFGTVVSEPNWMWGTPPKASAASVLRFPGRALCCDQ